MPVTLQQPEPMYNDYLYSKELDAMHLTVVVEDLLGNACTLGIKAADAARGRPTDAMTWKAVMHISTNFVIQRV